MTTTMPEKHQHCLATVLFILLTSVVSLAQAFSPGFRDAALTAVDTLGRLPMTVTNIRGTDPAEEAAFAPRELEVEKALKIVQRKAQTDADKEIYRLLVADQQFRLIAIGDDKMFWNHNLPLDARKPYSDRFVAEYKAHQQCSLEIQLILRDNLEELKPEQLEAGRKHLCLSTFESLAKKIEQGSGRR